MSVLPAQDSVLCFQADHGVPISVRSLVRQVTVQVADQVTVQVANQVTVQVANQVTVQVANQVTVQAAAVEDGGEDGTTEQRNTLSLSGPTLKLLLLWSYCFLLLSLMYFSQRQLF